MTMTTKVTILIPSKKTYADYSIQVEDSGGGTASGQWTFIDYMTTPTRQDYTKFNSFVDLGGDAFVDIGLNPPYKLFFFKLGTLKSPISALFTICFARIDMDVKAHMFSPGQASWAKKAEILPQMDEAIAIFWQ